MTYSGMCEDDIVWELFGKQPKHFLDIGAGGAEVLSNTRSLADKGWSGTWVDASYRSVPDLLVRQKKYPAGQIQVVHAAVSTKYEVRKIWNPSDYLITTLSVPLQERGHERTGAEEFYMSTIRVADVVAACPGPYEFISLDIEGLSLDVMKDIDYAALGCTCLCIEFLRKEHLGVDEEPIIRQYMETQGFRHYVTTQENVIMIK